MTEQGFEIKRLDDIRAEYEEQWRSVFGNADLSPESPDGQWVGILSEREASLWELAEATYSAGSVDSAIGAQLDEHAALSAVRRQAATKSTVVITCAGTPGTVLLTGRALQLDDSDTRWLSIEDATIEPGGTVDVTFEAEETGPLEALTGSSWTISTPVTGWTGATNAEDADLGSNLESSQSLRLRRRRALVALGDSAEAILAALIRVEDLFEAQVVENETAATDSEGRPPQSFEAIVRGGLDADIAAAIWSTKPSGIQAYGTNASAEVLGLDGVARTVNFTRAAALRVWIEIDLEVDEDFPADGLTLVRDEVLAYGQRLRTGQDVVPWAIKRIIETEGIVELTLRIGTTSLPANEERIVVSTRQFADIDSGRIRITRIN